MQDSCNIMLSLTTVCLKIGDEGDIFEIALRLPIELDTVEKSLQQSAVTSVGFADAQQQPDLASRSGANLCAHVNLILRLIGPILDTISKPKIQKTCKCADLAIVLLRLLQLPMVQTWNSDVGQRPSGKRRSDEIDLFSATLDILQHLLEKSNTLPTENLQKYLCPLLFSLPPPLASRVQSLLPPLPRQSDPLPKFSIYDKTEPSSNDVTSAVFVRNPYQLLDNFSYKHDGVTSMMQQGRVSKPECPYQA